MFDVEDPRIWVASAFILFIVLAYKKIGSAIVRALDERSAKIKAELDQARHLREEAEALLADYRQKQESYLREAELMLARARQDAEALGKQAEDELKSTMADRTKQALEKIALSEEKAIQDVRNHVVDVALAATRVILADHTSVSHDDLIALALQDIGRKIH